MSSAKLPGETNRRMMPALKRGKWRQVPIPPRVLSRLEPDARCFVRRLDDRDRTALQVIVGRSANAGWHLSIAAHVRTDLVGPDGGPIVGRIPTWKEIRDARYELLPDDIYMAMILPPKKDYVDRHPTPTTMHLYEIPGGVRING